MKYFLDSAKLEEIRYAREFLNIDGVTTNPKHIKNSGKSFLTIIHELADEFKEDPDFPISVEIDPNINDYEEMVNEGRKISNISKNFIIKIPCTENGIKAAQMLEVEGVRTNITLVFSPSQAIMPGRIGSKYVSPFVGWKENHGDDGFTYVKKIAEIYKNKNYDTEIIVAAVRNGSQIAEAALAGADIVTCGLQVYKDSLYHPFTDYGLKIFKDAWDLTKKD